MSQQVTFVTIGQLKGRTIAIGPDKKFQFIRGEMKVDEEDAGLISRALRFYGAFPKGDSEPYHLAACRKLGVDPETLRSLSAPDLAEPEPEPAPEPEPEPAPEPELAPEPEVSTELPERLQKVRVAVESLDDDNEEHWTSTGKPALPAVRKAFGGEVSRSEIDAVWKVILNDT